MSRFQQFVRSVFPGEAVLLGKASKITDPEKKAILDLVIRAAAGQEDNLAFDPSIDKRKYSYIKEWCMEKLAEVDVDMKLSRLLTWEQQILLDTIGQKDEKQFLNTIRDINAGDFNFVKCYEIARLYRHYLQVRLRLKEVELIHTFLDRYRNEYEISRQLNDKIHQATTEILNHYARKQNLNTEWIDTLSNIFFNESNDGYTRLLAWIRLVFIANSSNDYSFLENHFRHFEEKLLDCTFYSRRIMANFYSQYLLFYANRQNFRKAAYYGRLSVKLKNNDYLYYVNNLVAVLLRSKNTKEALALLNETSSLAASSSNFHNKVNHISYFIFALTDSGKAQLAESRGFVFYNVYKKEIFNYRWHLFFTAWFRAMTISGKYRNLVKLYKFYPKIANHELRHQKTQPGFPFLTFLYEIARYKLGESDITTLKHQLYALTGTDQGPLPEDIRETGKMVLKKEWEKVFQ